MDKRAVDSGQVGERAKEALVDGLDGLDGLSMMLVLGVVFWQDVNVLVGREGRCVGRRELRGLDG